MKKMILKRNFLFIILLTITLTVGCSKDDDNDKKIDETMLESLDQTKWEFDGIGFPAIYLRFNDTNTDFLELWAAIAEMECYLYANSEDETTLAIIENTKTLHEKIHVHRGHIWWASKGSIGIQITS